MKNQISNVLCLAATLIFALSSCAKEGENGIDPDVPVVPGGEETAYFNLSFSQMGIGSPIKSAFRAEDSNATETEVAVKTVDVFVFNTTGFLITHRQLDGTTDLTYSGDGSKDAYTTNSPIQTTSGEKRILVGVNLPSALVSRFTGTGSILAASEAFKITSIGDLVSADGIAMFSSAETTATLTADASTPNDVTVTVERLVAKVAVTKGDALNTTIPGGTLSDFAFSAGNVNLQLYPLKQFDTADPIVRLDPNYTIAQWDAADFVQIYDTVAVPSKYFDVPAFKDMNASGTTGSNLTAVYVTENTTAEAVEKAVTFASVRVKFTPDSYVNGDGTTSETGEAEDGDSFWTVTLNGGAIKFFNNEADATAFGNSQDPAVTPLKYEGGYCYYHLFLNPNGDFNTLRNDFYGITVTKINGLGKSTAIAGGDGQISQSADVNFSIEVVPWNDELVDSEL